MFESEQYKIKDETVFGRAKFTTPYKVSDELDNEARFVHVVNGSSRLLFPNGQVSLNAGDSLVMKCDYFVNNWQKNDDSALTEVVILRLNPSTLQHVYGNNLPEYFITKNSTSANSVEVIAPNSLMDNYVRNLRYYLDNPELINDELLALKIQELILSLINSDKSGKIKSLLSELFNNKEYAFKEIINSHLYDNVSNEDLAFFCNLSLSSFKRKFQEVFHTSPSSYINQKRLEKAAQLLNTSTLRISEIAYECGFSDVSYFSKKFTAAYNCSPSSYRNK